MYELRINDGGISKRCTVLRSLNSPPTDYEMMNYYTSTSPKTFFTQKIVCAKMILGGQGNDQIIRVVILQDNVKWRIHGEKEREQKFESEEDRLKA